MRYDKSDAQYVAERTGVPAADEWTTGIDVPERTRQDSWEPPTVALDANPSDEIMSIGVTAMSRKGDEEHLSFVRVSAKMTTELREQNAYFLARITMRRLPDGKLLLSFKPSHDLNWAMTRVEFTVRREPRSMIVKLTE